MFLISPGNNIVDVIYHDNRMKASMRCMYACAHWMWRWKNNKWKNKQQVWNKIRKKTTENRINKQNGNMLLNCSILERKLQSNINRYKHMHATLCSRWRYIFETFVRACTYIYRTAYQIDRLFSTVLSFLTFLPSPVHSTHTPTYIFIYEFT